MNKIPLEALTNILADPKIPPGQITVDTIYGFEIGRATFGLPPLTGAEREAEIVRVKAEAEVEAQEKRARALASERMSVGKLIELLSAYDPSMPVMTPGFDESGYDDARVTGIVPIRLGSGNALGQHEEVSPDKADVHALIIDFG